MAELDSESRIACRTPAEGRDGVTRIPKWKFDVLRRAIRAALSNGAVPFAELKDRVAPLLSAEDLAHMGSLGWHVTTVKLELEVRGDVSRLPGKGAQKLVWVE